LKKNTKKPKPKLISTNTNQPPPRTSKKKSLSPGVLDGCFQNRAKDPLAFQLSSGHLCQNKPESPHSHKSSPLNRSPSFFSPTRHQPSFPSEPTADLPHFLSFSADSTAAPSLLGQPISPLSSIGASTASNLFTSFNQPCRAPPTNLPSSIGEAPTRSNHRMLPSTGVKTSQRHAHRAISAIHTVSQ